MTGRVAARPLPQKLNYVRFAPDGTQPIRLHELMLEEVKPSQLVPAGYFIRHLERTDESDLFVALTDYVRSLKLRYEAGELSAHTVNSYTCAAKACVRSALESGEADLTVAQRHRIESGINSIAGLKVDSVSVPHEKVLSYDEIRRFLERCPDVRIALIAEFLAFTACRSSEALHIRVGDMKASRAGYPTVRLRGKGGKQRDIRVGSDLVRRIRQHFGGRSFLFRSPGGGPYDRSYVSMRISRLVKRTIGREHISAHSFRHSWATHTAKCTGRYKAIQRQLGHSSPSTTLALYTHDAFEWEEQEELFA